MKKIELPLFLSPQPQETETLGRARLMMETVHPMEADEALHWLGKAGRDEPRNLVPVTPSYNMWARLHQAMIIRGLWLLCLSLLFCGNTPAPHAVPHKVQRGMCHTQIERLVSTRSLFLYEGCVRNFSTWMWFSFGLSAKEEKMLILLLTPMYVPKQWFQFKLGPKVPDEIAPASVTKAGAWTPQQGMKRALPGTLYKHQNVSSGRFYISSKICEQYTSEGQNPAEYQMLQ